MAGLRYELDDNTVKQGRLYSMHAHERLLRKTSKHLIKRGLEKRYQLPRHRVVVSSKQHHRCKRVRGGCCWQCKRRKILLNIVTWGHRHVIDSWRERGKGQESRGRGAVCALTTSISAPPICTHTHPPTDSTATTIITPFRVRVTRLHDCSHCAAS